MNGGSGRRGVSRAEWLEAALRVLATESIDKISIEGLEYAWEVGSFEIGPQFDVDFVDGETEAVVGIVLGKGF